jgi:RNA polymerase sigma-70 factor (ECF subfamily)
MTSISVLTHAEDAGAGVLTGRFRRADHIKDDEAGTRHVAAAVERAKQGDREALRFLYVRYADNIYGYVASIVRDEHEAEDVTQHVFTKLLSVLPKYEQREVPFSAWVMRVARNVAVDHLRERRAVPTEEVRADDRGAWDDDGARQRALGLREALATLPDDQRRVLMLRHVVGLTPPEIAGRMGKSEPSIHGLHHRGRSALRSALTERGCAPTVAMGTAA